MSFTLCISLSLGSSKVSLSLVAQLTDEYGENYMDPISDGFKEIGNGNYLWRYDQFPDNFRGGIKFYANPSSILAFTSINPEDLNLAKEELEINVGHSSEKYNVNSVVHQDTGASIEVETGTEDPQSKIAQNEINEENSGDVIEVKTGLDNEDPIIEIETGTE